MPGGEVLHVNEIAHTGAIHRGVVVAEHVHMRPLAHRDLCHIGHEVVGNVSRVFTDQAAGVGTRRVEVAQHADAPSRAGLFERREHFFDHQLAVAIRVGV